MQTEIISLPLPPCYSGEKDSDSSSDLQPKKSKSKKYSDKPKRKSKKYVSSSFEESRPHFYQTKIKRPSQGHEPGRQEREIQAHNTLEIIEPRR